MKTSILSLVAAVALVPGLASAASFTAHLTHDQETSTGVLLTSGNELRPLSFGWANFLLNDARTELRFTVSIHHIDVTGEQTPLDLNDNLRAAHIHAGPLVMPGVNGPVVFGFFGTPFNDTAPTDLFVSPFVDGVGGIFTTKWDLTEGQNTTLQAQLPNLFAGRAYLNFHTTQFPGGEIRGQILAVPETATSAAMLVAALGGLLGARHRRRAHRA